MPRSLRHLRGFTLIELMVVVALISVILVLAIPSFTGMLARKRLEGVALELGTDLQYARSEAVQKNAQVQVIFGSNCYAIYVVGITAATDCTNLGMIDLINPVVPLRRVQITTGPILAFTPATVGQLFVEFEPVRGTAANVAGTVNMGGDVLVTSGAGNWQLQARVNRYGRMKTCSPNATVTGFSNDCSFI